MSRRLPVVAVGEAGCSDGAEVLAGTDPLDPDDFPIAAVPVTSVPGLALLALLLLGPGLRAGPGCRFRRT